ncbi:MAG: DUF6377 domain-containing protein [Candidatus Cryptobacteroides sp.]
MKLLAAFLAIICQSGLAKLSDLDRLVADYADYEQIRLDEIDSCKALIKDCPQQELPQLYSRLQSLYYGFQIDSALVYAHRGIEQSRLLGDKVQEYNAIHNLAASYQMSGSYLESLALLDSLDKSRLSRDLLVRCYSTYNTIYSALETLSIDTGLKQQYRDEAVKYKRLMLDLVPDNLYVICDTLLRCGKAQEAYDTMLPFVRSLPPHNSQIGPAAYSLADICLELGRVDEALEYLIASSCSDLERGNKEYTSLVQLSLMLYERGDVRRAYRYLQRCVDDATYCGARLRIDEIAPLVSTINGAYNRAVRRNYLAMSLTIVVLLLLALVTFSLSVVLRKQKEKLSESNRMLLYAQELKDLANRKTLEASNIKNAYITRLMLECIARIERLEEYRKSLNRMAIARDFESLQKTLKSTSYVDDEWKSFYNVFDSTFLSLFPTFVEDFNSLLLPEHRISVGQKKMLTPELRIYALIRLDIDSTEKIASLLRYSKATIYAYRSRTRLKALNPQSFEEDVKRIASI